MLKGNNSSTVTIPVVASDLLPSRFVDVIKKKGSDSMDSAKNLRFVEGEEEESSGERSDLGPNPGSCEIEEEIEMIAAQKNRERFAIKKTYSVEVIILILNLNSNPVLEK